MHLWFWGFVSLNGTQSLAEAVVEDMVNIFVRFCNDVFNFDLVGSTRFENKHAVAKLLFIKTHDAIGLPIKLLEISLGTLNDLKP